jgi:catechol 2,3-dioxygenase-like lactoylglutathione lyase family enzyme
VNVASHATVLLVDDVARALDYYRDQLGFEGRAWEVNPSHYAYVSRGGCHVHFACFHDAGPRPNSETVPPDMFDLYIYVDDLEALHEELKARGADILSAPHDTEYGLREIRVRDPHGYILAFGNTPEGGTTSG